MLLVVKLLVLHTCESDRTNKIAFIEFLPYHRPSVIESVRANIEVTDTIRSFVRMLYHRANIEVTDTIRSFVHILYHCYGSYSTPRIIIGLSPTNCFCFRCNERGNVYRSSAVSLYYITCLVIIRTSEMKVVLIRLQVISSRKISFCAKNYTKLVE